MRFSKSVRAITASVCCLGMLQPTLALENERKPAAPFAVATPVPPIAASPARGTFVDLELDATGTLVGQLVNQNGSPIPSAPVAIWRDGQLIQVTMTNGKGAYRLTELSGGRYRIESGDRGHQVRCWTFGHAPPNSIASLRTIADEDVVRAQQRRGAVCGVVNPWIITGLVAAAVAVPIALHNNREDRPASD